MTDTCQYITQKNRLCTRRATRDTLCTQHYCLSNSIETDTHEENVDESAYLYHGTSLAYIREIIDHGLTGRYPDKLYDMLLSNYESIRYDGNFQPSYRSGYIRDFIDRQSAVRMSGQIDLSFTSNLEVASEFANSARVNGEGPGEMIREIYRAYQRHQYRNTDELKKMFKLFGVGPYQKPLGIILAVKKTDLQKEYARIFSQKPKLLEYYRLMIDKGDNYEIKINIKIKPEIIYIYEPNTHKYIKLKSDVGETYISCLSEISVNTPVDEVSEPSIPFDKLNKPIRLTTDELVEYKIKPNGTSDSYKSYIFINPVYIGNDIWSLEIQKKPS